MNRMGGTIGYIIGACLVLPLILYIGNKFFLKNNNEADNVLGQYLNSTIELEFKIPLMDLAAIETPYRSDLITIQLKSKNMGRSNSKYTDHMYQDIYISKYHKYVRISMFDVSNLLFYDISGKDILLKVNKQDFNNSYYGTKEHPLICFSVRGANGPILVDGRGTANVGKIINKDTDKEQEEYNAYMYFTYVMSSKEFKERFKERD